MSAHDLLNFSNELIKSEKIRGLSSILLLFRNMFNKFNNTGARLLYSIYHMALKLFKIAFCACKLQDFAIFYAAL